jgi:hypothetical protein
VSDELSRPLRGSERSSGVTRTQAHKTSPKGTAVNRMVHAHRHHGHRHPHAVLPDLVAADRPLHPELAHLPSSQLPATAFASASHAQAAATSLADTQLHAAVAANPEANNPPPADPLSKAELLKKHLAAFYPKPVMLMVLPSGACAAVRYRWPLYQSDASATPRAGDVRNT